MNASLHASTKQELHSVWLDMVVSIVFTYLHAVCLSLVLPLSPRSTHELHAGTTEESGGLIATERIPVAVPGCNGGMAMGFALDSSGSVNTVEFNVQKSQVKCCRRL